MAVFDQSSQHLVENSQFAAVRDHFLVDHVIPGFWVDIPAHQIRMVDNFPQLHDRIVHFDAQAHSLLDLIPADRIVSIE